MFDRLQRRWELTRECFELLAADRSLLVFPLLSAIAMTLIIASFAVPLSACRPRPSRRSA